MKYSPSESGHFDGQRGYGYVSIEKFVDAARSVNAGLTKPEDYDANGLPTIANTVLTTAILNAGRISLDEKRPVGIRKEGDKWVLEWTGHFIWIWSLSRYHLCTFQLTPSACILIDPRSNLYSVTVRIPSEHHLDWHENVNLRTGSEVLSKPCHSQRWETCATFDLCNLEACSGVIAHSWKTIDLSVVDSRLQ